jgi:archaellum component FlaC
MTKFLFKLAVLAVGIFLLMQVPYFAHLREQIMADVFQKVDNVANEVNRVQDQVTGIKDKVTQAEEKVNAVTNQVTDTVNNVKSAFVSVDKAAADIKNAMNGGGVKTTENLQDPKVPAPTTPSATPTAPATK